MARVSFFADPYLWAGAPPCGAGDDDGAWEGIGCDAGNEERGAEAGRPNSRDGIGVMGTG
jgi:hypothetical protein